jgi:ectoine hydroxylase-related dioxygenase (phytanoyl-CoA dioxygenase family)
MKFAKKKYLNDGYFVQKKIISKSDINIFSKEIKQLLKIYNKKNFANFFKNTKDRDLIYKKLQNLNSVRSIVQNVCKKFEKYKIYSKLEFKVPTIDHGLIISLPNESKTLNPLHQDIYNFLSFNLIKIWLPLTNVNNKNGSMSVYKSSNNLGFIEPKYKDKNSTYPEIDHKLTTSFKKITFDLSPGDCVIFNPLILHKSEKNKSKFTRFSISIDIQDFYINGDSKIISKMISIKNQRSRRRKLLKK